MLLLFYIKRLYIFLVVFFKISIAFANREEYFIVPHNEKNLPNNTQSLKEALPSQENLNKQKSDYLRPIITVRSDSKENGQRSFRNKQDSDQMNTSSLSPIQKSDSIIQTPSLLHLSPLIGGRKKSSNSSNFVSSSIYSSLPVTGIFSGSFSRRKKNSLESNENKNSRQETISSQDNLNINLKPQKTIILLKSYQESNIPIQSNIPIRGFFLKNKKIKRTDLPPNTPLKSNVPRSIHLKEESRRDNVPLSNLPQISNVPTIKIKKNSDEVFTPDNLIHKKPMQDQSDNQQLMIYVTLREDTKKAKMSSEVLPPQIVVTESINDEKLEKEESEKKDVIFSPPPQLIVNYQ